MLRAGGMAQWVTALVAKADRFNSIPRAHMVEEKYQLP